MEILKYPDNRLNVKCNPVSDITLDIKEGINKMHKVFSNNLSLFGFASGLAANQIGLNDRIIIFKRLLSKPITMINPELVYSTFPFLSFDLCASVPGVIRPKKRNLYVNISYTDLDGVKNSMRLFGSTACTFQHELDHLDGKLIID